MKRTLCVALLLGISPVLDAKPLSDCEKMASQFFSTNLANHLGPTQKPRQEKPEEMRSLMVKVKIHYPNEDMFACINEGLKHARAVRGIYVKDTLHGGL